MTLLLRVLAAALSGLAQLAALEPYGLWPLAVLGPALLLAAVHGTRPRRAAWLGAVSGACLMVPLIKWQEVFGVDVWLLIAAAETVYFVPMAAGIALVARLPGWPLWTAALWVAQEFCRARFPLGGFPWGKLAFSQPDTPFAGYAALGSSALVTFTVALVGAALAAAARALWSARRGTTARRLLPPLLGGLAATALVPLGGTLALHATALEEDHTATVALVQGDVPNAGEMNILGERMQVLRNHVDGVHALARLVRQGEAPQPDLVILPENASDIDAYTDPQAADLISAAADDIGVPLLFGITRYSPDGTEREIRSVVWHPASGPGDHYTKRYLVPFGEYVPMRDLFATVVTRLEQVGSDAVPGTEPGALDMNGTTVAAAICFDIAFDLPVRESVAAGGQIIVVPTNNANYNFTGQSAQQLAITRLRAVEHGRPAVVAATSGISAVVDQRGHVLYRSPEAEPAVHVAEVPAMRGLTPATRLGALPETALALLGLGAVAAALLRSRRNRARQEQPDGHDTAPLPTG
ncbi:apolipoprotein N-acyltransferase [Thermobifida cellulosilytica]|uniref:Apolipoprotein N-acyltransferase n=1 Tax=Thermobifida cellulosilytica TB100 TaxID=665004 RepID=A0A147KJJ7_THECS|nr:apolipoprotein N-acyltransferase [Thermobifida cellulosilytica]KUP97457.1 acyltransferase [Thermobifida cellulosilytica TB100]